MSSVFDHLHIKSHTAGSSNELSFDVLDNARGGLDSKKRRASGTPAVFKPQRQHAESYHASPKAKSSTLSSQPEVTRRKKERRVHSARLLAVAIMAAAAVMVGAAYVSYDYYEDIQQFRAKFETLVEEFVMADEVLPSVEAFVADPFGFSMSDRSDLDQSIARSKAQIKQIEQQASLDSELAVTEQDSLAISQVLAAAKAREALLDATDKMIEIVDESASELAEVNAVWNTVLGADQQARSATTAANKAATDKEIQDAIEKTVSARTQMEQAREQLTQMSSEGMEFDVSRQLEYLDARISSLEHAVETGNALLEGDRYKATAENDLYNSFDQQAVAVAEDLPPSLEEALKGSYMQEIEKLKASYEEARNVAIESDSLIRSYLG